MNLETEVKLKALKVAYTKATVLSKEIIKKEKEFDALSKDISTMLDNILSGV